MRIGLPIPKLVLALGIIAVVLTGCALDPGEILQSNLAAGPASGPTRVPAPRLSGPTLAGPRLTADLRDHRTVLVFWASWCGPCRNEQPELTQMAKDLASQDIHFIGIDLLDRDQAAAVGFIQEFQVPYPNLYDPDGSIAAAYQVDSPPTIILVNPKGLIAARINGETTSDALERLIQAKLLA